MVAPAIENNLLIYVQTLAAVHDTLAGTVFKIIHDDLGLVKQSGRCVTKLLSQDQRGKMLKMYAAFVTLAQENGRGVQSMIIEVDERAMSMHTPETKVSIFNGIKRAHQALLRARLLPVAPTTFPGAWLSVLYFHHQSPADVSQGSPVE